MVPSNQYIVYGNDTTLSCSYNDPSVGVRATVERNDDVVSNRITGANLDDEGEYVCDIFISNPRASIQRSFTVHVIGKLHVARSLSLSTIVTFSTYYTTTSGIIINDSPWQLINSAQSWRQIKNVLISYQQCDPNLPIT